MYRQLLDHPNDMTSTLQRFHDEEIRVHVLESRKDDACYEREVLLVTRNTRKTVEFGAISFARAFPTRRSAKSSAPKCRWARSCDPSASIRGKPLLRDRVGRGHERSAHTVGHDILYGRCNEITNTDGQVLAEIVEILPPAMERQKNA